MVPGSADLRESADFDLFDLAEVVSGLINFEAVSEPPVARAAQIDSNLVARMADERRIQFAGAVLQPAIVL